MRRHVALLPLFAILLALPAASPAPAHEKVVLQVRGMTCGACTSIIRDEVKKLEGVVSVAADYEKGTATVEYVKGKVTVEQIVAAINKTGFKASMPAAPAGGGSR
jgi:copper chaperone CopZ